MFNYQYALIPVALVLFTRADGLTFREFYIFGIRLFYMTAKK